MDDITESCVILQWQDRYLYGSDSWLQYQVSSLFISHSECMLQHAWHDSTQTEWWFDDTWSVLFLHHIHNFLFKAHVIFCKLQICSICINSNELIGFKFCLKLGLLFLCGIFQVWNDSLGVFLELLSDNFSVKNDWSLKFRSRFFESSWSNKFGSWTQSMVCQIKSWPVSTSNNLNPSRSSQGFSIPTVACVMGHLIFQMLSKSDVSISFKSNILQEEEDSDNEVSQCLVIDNFLFNSLSDWNPFWLAHFLLDFSAVKWKLYVGNTLEFLVTLIKRINKVFNFSHLEFSDSQ